MVLEQADRPTSQLADRLSRRVPHALARLGEADRLVYDQADAQDRHEQERIRAASSTASGIAAGSAPLTTSRCLFTEPTLRSRKRMCASR